MPTLVEFVHNLPTEIFDEIKAYTFAVDGEEVVEITKDYKPPSLLQVDRTSRAALTAEYYATKMFVIDLAALSIASKWLESFSTRRSEPSKKICYRKQEETFDDWELYFWGNFVIPIKIHGYKIDVPINGHFSSKPNKWCEAMPEYWTADLDIGASLAEAQEAAR